MPPHASTLNLQGFLTPFLELFKNPNIAIAISGGMVALAIVILCWFLIRHMVPMLLALRRVKKQLRKIPDEDAFHTDFAKIDEVISRERLLKHGWEEFKETLIFPAPDTAGPIRNTARPSNYLNVGSVASELKLPWYQAIPNYFVGIGLLFTFLGLVAALYFASQGVAGDIQQAKASLQHLLTAATFKFSTSIAGLFSSLLLSIASRILILRVQRYFDQLCQLLEQRMLFVTREALAFQQLDELRKQSLQLERFNTDFAVEVAKALETRLNDSLGPVIGQAVQPMATAIDNMTKNFGELNQTAMNQMVGDFKNSLTDTTQTEMTNLAQTLAKLEETLRGTISGIGQSSGAFGSRVEQAAERLEAIVSGAARTMENGISGSASQLETLMKSVSDSLRADAATASQEFGTAVQGIATNFQSSLTDATAVWNAKFSESTEQMSESVNQAGQALSGHVSEATTQLAGVITPFSEEIKRLGGTLHILDGRLQSQLKGFDGSVELLLEIVSSLDQALVNLRDAGAPIASTAEQFGRTAQQVEAVSQSVQHSHTELTKLATSVREGAERVQQSWNNYRERFEKVDTDLATVFEKLQAGTESYHHRMSEYVSEMDNGFSKSIDMLRGGITALQETIEDLTEATDQMARTTV